MVSGAIATPLLHQLLRHLRSGGQPDHLGAGQVAERQVGAQVVERDVDRPAERAGRQVAQRVGEQGVDPLRLVDVGHAAGRGELGVTAGREVVHPSPVGQPVAQQLELAAQAAAEAGEVEHVEQRTRRTRETAVPVVGVAHHAVAEPERRDRELQRHRRYVGRCGVGLDEHATVGEDVVDDSRVEDPRQVVVAQHPLVVQRHLLAGLAEVLRRGRGRGVVDDPVVEVDHRHVGLGDDQVLVVAGVRDQRGAAPRPRAAGRGPSWRRPVRSSWSCRP